VLIWAGLQHVPGSAPLRWRFGNPTDLAELIPATATHVGRMLLEENTAPVNHLYNEHHAPNLTYTYRPAPRARVGRSPNCSTRCTATSTRPASTPAGTAAEPARSAKQCSSG
jgi:hypothetical protein